MPMLLRSLAPTLIAAAVYGCLALFVTNSYYQLMLTLVLVWASFGLSWNILSGYTGLVSFGHAAFFGLGAYTTALGQIHFDVSPWLSIPAAAVVGGVAGLLVGFPTFRLRGHYFALAMLAYPLALLYVFEWLGYQELTLPIKRENPFAYMQFSDPRIYTLVALAMLLAIVAMTHAVERSRFGVALLAIKQNEAAATDRRHAGKVLLSVKGLSKSFGGLKAVQNVGFDVREGMILGIIGPNGAGKTTLFNLLNGFTRPDSGEVLLDGRNMIGRKPHELCKAGVGRTFQIMRPFPRMSVRDNVRVGSYVHALSEHEARRLADDAVGRVGLQGVADKVATALTTKELRLMELARALAGKPRLLLLDETLAGLGHGEADEVVAVVQRLAREGVTIAIIEHTMQSMVRLVDHFVVLDHGAVLADGNPADITRNPQVIEAYLGKKWMTRAQA